MGDTTPADDGREWPHADMLGQLSRELEKANERAVQSGRPGRLRWAEATIELGVTWERSGDGGIDLKVVRLGGGLTKANTTTITVKVVPVGSVAAAPARRTRPANDERQLIPLGGESVLPMLPGRA